MNKVIVIAEAGVNHNGSIELAKKLIDAAAFAKADFVKFQSFKADKLATKTASQAEYQVKNSGVKESQYEMLKRLELSDKDQLELYEYCNSKNIKFLSTPFDEESATFLAPLVPLFKVSSSDLDNFLLLKHLCSFKKPIVLSTGMSDIEEIKCSVKYIEQCWSNYGIKPSDHFEKNSTSLPFLSALHCTTAYPTPLEAANIKAMNTIKQDVSVNIGYSDHTLGHHASLAAVALGATIIEKHFTLDTAMPGPDHRASLPASELPDFITSIRNIELVLGSSEKTINSSEVENKKVARKGLYFARDLSKGTVVKESDLVFMRPRHEIGPEHFFELLGRKILFDVKKGEAIKKDHFQ
tara:strand:- start:11947 stop:13005 length:1059 start_codon:yes stop_codon:yes gene_type:complete